MADELDPARADEATYVKMWSHIVQKGFQLGSVAGAGAVVPITLLRLGLTPDAQRIALSNAGKSTIGGILLAGVLRTSAATHASQCCACRTV